MDETKELLENEIAEQIRGLSVLENGSEEKARAVADVQKLYSLKVEEEKNKIDEKSSKTDRLFKTITDGLGIVLPLGFYAFWMKRGLKFEETGTFTSKTFQGLTKFFKPTRK